MVVLGRTDGRSCFFCCARVINLIEIFEHFHSKKKEKMGKGEIQVHSCALLSYLNIALVILSKILQICTKDDQIM